jgi:hypothetical protein
MSFPVPTIEVLEKCLMDKQINCFSMMEPVSLNCCENIVELINTLFNTLNCSERFPKLNKIIMADIRDELININRDITMNKIKEMILIEANYIWTDEHEFKIILRELSINHLTIDLLRNILAEYYKTVVRNIQNNIPKVIMTFLIKKIQNNIQLLLLNNITKNNYSDYLIEEPGIIVKREQYRNIIKNLTEARMVLGGMITENNRRN